jgi:hypothetical protein
MGYGEEMMGPKMPAEQKPAVPKTPDITPDEGGRHPIRPPNTSGLSNLAEAMKGAGLDPNRFPSMTPPPAETDTNKQERRILPSVSPTVVAGAMLGAAAVVGTALVIAGSAPVWVPAAAAAGAFVFIFGIGGRSKGSNQKNSS